jgi:hypothetical protein
MCCGQPSIATLSMARPIRSVVVTRRGKALRSSESSGFAMRWMLR